MSGHATTVVVPAHLLEVTGDAVSIRLTTPGGLEIRVLGTPAELQHLARRIRGECVGQAIDLVRAEHTGASL